MIKYFLKHIALFAFALTFGVGCISTNAAAEEVNVSAKTASTDKPSNASKKSSKANKKKSSKDSADSAKKSTSSSKKSTSSSKKSTSSAKKSSSKKVASKGKKSSKNAKKTVRNDRISKAVEAQSDSTKPIFTEEEIAQYKAMPFETWESPSGVSELGLPIEPGFVQPYPYGNLMRQYCSTNSKHKGHDIGVVGEKNSGMGSVINAMTKSVVTFIGKPDEDIGEFGKLDKRSGDAVRTGHTYPRHILVPGYGLVYPFSLNHGRWRSGYVLVTKVLEGPLKDYTIRYMHMGGIRPDLKPGSVVEAGEHIAIMGSTAIMDSFPHVHVDMVTPAGTRANIAPYIGIPQGKPRCKSAALAKDSVAAQKSKPAKSKSSAKSSSSKNKSKSTNAKSKQRSRKAYLSHNDVTEPAQTRILART